LAVLCFLGGIVLYIWQTRSKTTFFYTTNLISWLLFALTPALILFSVFPASTATGEVFGFSLSGAVALFILIWWYGTRTTLKAVKLDELTMKAEKLERDLEKERGASSKPISTPLLEACVHEYRLKSHKNKRIGLITGDLQKVKSVDVWVNSENTNMQMARFYENSISAVIRYMGSKKDPVGNVTDDIIQKELNQIMGGNSFVQPTTVLVTGPGELATSNNVKKIFHVASVQGEVGHGYRPIHNIEYCVKNALEKAVAIELQAAELHSIIFPLLGSQTAQGDLKVIVPRLFQEAITFMENTPDNPIKIYFVVRTERELDACREFLDQSERLISI
jgi:hypothetical protein